MSISNYTWEPIGWHEYAFRCHAFVNGERDQRAYMRLMRNLWLLDMYQPLSATCVLENLVIGTGEELTRQQAQEKALTIIKLHGG